MARMLILAALLAGSAQAQIVINKCVDVHGNASYSTNACASGQRTAAIKSYGPIHDDPQAREKVLRADEQQQARYREQHRQQVYYRTSSPETPRDRQKRECAAARQRANDARGKGYSSTALVRLDKQAIDACFGL